MALTRTTHARRRRGSECQHFRLWSSFLPQCDGAHLSRKRSLFLLTKNGISFRSSTVERHLRIESTNPRNPSRLNKSYSIDRNYFSCFWNGGNTLWTQDCVLFAQCRSLGLLVFGPPLSFPCPQKLPPHLCVLGHEKVPTSSRSCPPRPSVGDDDRPTHESLLNIVGTNMS